MARLTVDYIIYIIAVVYSLHELCWIEKQRSERVNGHAVSICLLLASKSLYHFQHILMEKGESL